MKKLVLLPASVWIALSVTPLAGAQDDSTPAGSLRSVLEGVVRTSAGEPAPGSVIVSSAGGWALTGADGSFRLEVELPRDASSVLVHAVHDTRASSGRASVTVPLVNLARRLPVGVLTLEEALGCGPGWQQTFGQASGGVNDVPAAFTVFDDGSGPALYAAGDISPGDANIAKWNGWNWTPVSGLSNWVYVLTAFDDGGGSGPALYAGGAFSTAGSLTVTTSPAGTALGGGMDPSVTALVAFDDGSGPALYAGGHYSFGGGTGERIARWDGTTWSTVGGGIDGDVWALQVVDDGSGPALYAGGLFDTAGGLPAHNIARWDGTSWSALGNGTYARVLALTVFDDGSGPTLYAAGYAPYVERWDGASWVQVGDALNGAVQGLTVFDDGSGPALYAGGNFTTAGSTTVNRIARLGGSSWVPLATGLNGTAWPLTVFDDQSGAGPALYAGGFFTTAGGLTVKHVARWDGERWTHLGKGLNGAVRSLEVMDEGDGPALYAGGDFSLVAGQSAAHIARWNGDTWTGLGNGVNSTVLALEQHDDGSGAGAALYAGGAFSFAGASAASCVARWDGSAWAPMGAGIDTNGPFPPVVRALASFDDGGGPALYAGGFFESAGGVAASDIARWKGSSWEPVGGGTSARVYALTVFDDGGGAGPALYAGGFASTLERWDGTSWMPFGAPLDGRVEALAVFDDGSGPALHAGGNFVQAGGVTVNHVAKWDGSSWVALGSGLNGLVNDLTVFDDGSGGGPALHASGPFTSAGSVAAKGVARWNSTDWEPLAGGLSSRGDALAVFDDGSGAGPALFVGGEFTLSPGGDRFLARWQGCPDAEPPVLDCPASVERADSGPPGEVVTFTVSFSDRDPNASVACEPPSGSFFPRGTTLVTCTATDASGNSSECMFPVHVLVARTRAR